MATKIDPVTLAILTNSLFWIAEEMNVYLTKSAFSTNIKVRRDCSCALYDAKGNMVAQGEFVPVHLGVMSQSLKAVLEVYPPETMCEGDVIIHNDPYSMGSHLWDIMLFKPVFHSGKLIAFAGSLAHHVDIGGSSTSRVLPTIFEEGLRLPPVKLYEKGELQKSLMTVIEANVRTPYELRGDLAAQTAANYRGEVRILELVDKYGADVLGDYFEAILSYSERGMRNAIAKLPETVAEFEDFIEHDGINAVMTKIKVRLEVKNGELYFDFDGSGPAGVGGINSPWSLTHSAVYYAVKSVLACDIPTNYGAYRPIHILRPKYECIVDAYFPHAVGGCTSNPAQRIVDVVIGAFSKLVPEKVCACDGHWPSGRFVGRDPRTNQFSPYVETYACGRGAKHDQDGADAHQTHMTNTANAPIEIIELEHPLRVEKYEMVIDSGGAGEFRGGVGISRQLTALTDMSANAFPVRPNTRPYGLMGGAPGSSDMCGITLSDGSFVTSSRNVKAGNRIIIRSSGGGGWGEPRRRDPQKVLQDVLDGYVSAGAAKAIYKVVVDLEHGVVDQKETDKLRAEYERGCQ